MFLFLFLLLRKTINCYRVNCYKENMHINRIIKIKQKLHIQNNDLINKFYFVFLYIYIYIYPLVRYISKKYQN